MAARITGELWMGVALPYATFALGIRDGRVVDAPPIAWKTMRRIGTDWQTVKSFYRQQGGLIRPLPELTAAARQRLRTSGDHAR